MGAILRKYNASATINFDLFQVDGIDFEPAASFASGDLKIMKDEGAEANTSNLPTDEGQGYSLVLTATEMSAARVVVYIVDQTATKVWLDRTLIIETYGHASGQHAFDLDTATQSTNVTQWLGTACATPTTAGVPEVDMTHIGGATQSATDLKDFADAGYDPATNKVTGVLLVDTTTSNTDMRGTDSAATATNLATVDTVVDGIQTDLSNATDGLGAIKTAVDAIPTTAMRGTDSAATATALATVDTNVDAILVDTAQIGTAGAGLTNINLPNQTMDITGNLSGSVGSLTGHTVQTGDSYARIGAPAGASVSADVADVPTVSEFNARTLVAASYFDPAADTVATVTNVTNSADTVLTGTAAGGASGSISLDASATTTNSTYVGCNVSIVSGTGVGQSRYCSAYNGGTKVLSILPTWTTTPDTSSVYAIRGAGHIQGITGTKNILDDMNDVTTAQVNTEVDTGITDAALATATALATVDTNVDSILADTADMQPKIGTPATSVSADIAAVKIDTAATLVDTAQMNLGIVTSTTKAGTLTTTACSTNLSEATDDHYIGRIVTFTDGVLAGQSSDITDYVGTNGVITYTAMTEAASSGDAFKIT